MNKADMSKPETHFRHKIGSLCQNSDTWEMS